MFIAIRIHGIKVRAARVLGTAVQLDVGHVGS